MRPLYPLIDLVDNEWRNALHCIAFDAHFIPSASVFMWTGQTQEFLDGEEFKQ